MDMNSRLADLYTPWGADIDRQCPLADYPRPQLRRERWQCLNGPWQYAICPGGTPPGAWEGDILVPFSPESPLSGVGRQLLPGQTLWYRRRVGLPKPPAGRRLRLHFGAVDQCCRVWVNGAPVGEHVGGYWPFSFDITDYLGEGDTELTLAVTDESDGGDQAYGKQRLRRGGIWYTGQSGIWQTVWCEEVPARPIEGLRITPLYGESAVHIAVTGGETRCTVGVLADGQCVARGETVDGSLRIELPGFRCWSPQDPFLYDLEVVSGDDRVYSYFGMRAFGLLTGPDGVVRPTLNGQAILHNGLLDQGYWSDGLYTPPSDAAMVWELEGIKRMGFNMLRKHIKIEPLRWYYHCDRLGVLVWQDFVSGGGPYRPFATQYAPWLGLHFGDGPGRYGLHGRQRAAGRAAFERDARRTLDLLYNCVSLAVWVPFNEGWGQFEAAKMCGWVRQADPTRLVDHASGYHDQGVGDFHSHHVYYKAFRPRADRHPGRVLALTEFGGYSLPTPGHMASDRLFGYRRFESADDLWQALMGLYQRDVLPALGRGLGALIYTQVSDVEDEINGLFTYDRRVIKVDEGRMAALNARLYAAFEGGRAK